MVKAGDKAPFGQSRVHQRPKHLRVWIDGQQKPVAFGLVEATGTVSMGNVTFSIQLTSHDLREVIQSRCGG